MPASSPVFLAIRPMVAPRPSATFRLARSDRHNDNSLPFQKAIGKILFFGKSDMRSGKVHDKNPAESRPRGRPGQSAWPVQEEDTRERTRAWPERAPGLPGGPNNFFSGNFVVTR